MTNLTLAQIRERLTSQSAPTALLNIITRMEEIAAEDATEPGGSVDFGGLLWDALLDELGAAAETPAPSGIPKVGIEFFGNAEMFTEEHEPEEPEDDAEPRFRNFYKCDRCGNEWEDVWSAQVDDDCPACGFRHMTPYKSEDA